MQRSLLVSVLSAVGAPSQNIWPTRSFTPKQYMALSKIKHPKLSPFGAHMMEKRQISALYGGISGAHHKKIQKKVIYKLFF